MYRSYLLAGAAILFAVPALTQGAAAQGNIETVTSTAEKLDAARAAIQTQVGASTFTVTADDILNQPGGDNLQLNSVILQTPGVAQDSFGQVHVRGEHNGLQYRLNGIILPEGIAVFGQSLDPRLAQSVRLIDGALPAEYGDQTGGIIDMQTKSGLFSPGGHVGIYGGSHNTHHPQRRLWRLPFGFVGDYFVSGDYTTDSLGIESPDGSSNPAHDRTKQWHGFALVQDILDQNSSITAVLGTSNAMFQIPNLTGPFLQQPSGLGSVVGLLDINTGSGNYQLVANGVTSYPSSALNEQQREITHYGTFSYLRSQGALDFQLSVFGRYSSLNYTPGANLSQDIGELLYNGYAQNAGTNEAYGTGLKALFIWATTTRSFRRHLSGRRSGEQHLDLRPAHRFGQRA